MPDGVGAQGSGARRHAPETVLRAIDFNVRRRFRAAEAPPFLGLALDVEELPRIEKIFQVLRNVPLERLLKSYGNAASWAICATLSEDYGTDSHRVWKPLSELFGRPLEGVDRQKVHRAFVGTCARLGLATEGFERPVQAFLTHAGVARAQLPHLARAFLCHTRAVGRPELSDTVELNRWEDDSLDHLHPSLTVMKRPILLDGSAWTARQYLAWLGDPAALQGRGAYLDALGRALDEAKAETGGGGGISMPARPRLIWHDDRPGIEVPEGAGRMRISLDGTILRLRRGEVWPLPAALGERLTWEGDPPGVLTLYPDAELVAFDVDTGRQVELREETVGRCSASAPVLILSARVPFMVGGQQAQPAGPALFIHGVDLRDGPLRIEEEDRRFELTGVARTRLAVLGRPVARGRLDLWGPDAVLEVDLGRFAAEARVTGGEMVLAVDAGDGPRLLSRAIDDRGRAAVRLADLAAAAAVPTGSDPVRLSVNLLRGPTAGAKLITTGYRRTLDVWPGFRGMAGPVLETADPPTTVVEERLRHVERDDRGRLCLDRTSGSATATIAFRVGGRTTCYQVAWPGLTVSLETDVGETRPWRLGDTLVVGGGRMGDALVIRSPDRDAALRIGERRVEGAFRASATWAVPASTLGDAACVMHVSASGVETCVAEIAHAAEPKRIGLRVWSGGTEFRLDMGRPVRAIRFEREDEDGTHTGGELRFDHHITSERPAAFATARCVQGEVVAELRAVDQEGLSLVDVSVLLSGETRWTRLTNGRGDRFAVPLKGCRETAEARPSVLRRLDGWLSECHARATWEAGVGDALRGAWATLARRIAEAPGGAGALLAVAHEAPEAEDGWLPMCHVLEVWPELHTAPLHAFQGLRDAETPAGRALGWMADLVSGPLRAKEWIELPAFGAFSNVAQAMRGEPLRGFVHDALLARVEPDRARGRGWDGTVALGPAHAGAALLRLRERLEDHRLLGASDGEGRMSMRSHRLNLVTSALGRDVRTGLMDEEGDDRSAQMIDRAIVAYARAVRSGNWKELVAKAAKQSGLSTEEVLAAMGEMVRLAPELLAFHLLAVELERRTRT